MLKLTSVEIAKHSVYEIDYLHWNIGFNYYSNKHELQNKDQRNDLELVYARGGFIVLGYAEKSGKPKILSRSKIITKGKQIFRKIKLKLRNKICEEWCDHKAYLSVLPGILAEGMLDHQYDKLADAIHWLFEQVPQIDPGAIPELPYIIFAAASIAGLFIKINMKFDEMCDCDFKKKNASKNMRSLKIRRR